MSRTASSSRRGADVAAADRRSEAADVVRLLRAGYSELDVVGWLRIGLMEVRDAAVREALRIARAA
jgi:hypothetical protein